MVVVSWASDKTQNRKLFVWPLLLIGALALRRIDGSHSTKP
jgi:hypothetical protein